MQTMSIKLYDFDELEASAKERARDWYRTESGAFESEWYDQVYEDAAAIADILGIDLRTRRYRLKNGETSPDLGINIMFKGFSRQGDGACFEGTYRYAKDAAKAIRQHAPRDEKLHRIADELQAIQQRHFYRLVATVKHSGNYYHAYSTDVEVEMRKEGLHEGNPDTKVEKEVTELLRDFMNWIYAQLQSEYEALTADEAVDEAISDHGYKFTQQGNRNISVSQLN